MSYYSVAELNATGGIDWIEQFNDLERNRRFRHIKGGDISTLVVASDLLVTDGSSVAFEAFLAGRPVVFFDSPRFFDEIIPAMYGISPDQARNDLRYNSGRHAGPIASTVVELVGLVTQMLNDPTAYVAEREAIRQELLFNPGNAGKIAANEILCLLDGDCRE